jgi:hypothetical protein
MNRGWVRQLNGDAGVGEPGQERRLVRNRATDAHMVLEMGAGNLKELCVSLKEVLLERNLFRVIKRLGRERVLKRRI